MRSPEEVVDAVYAAAFAGNPEGALAHCDPDGRWHPLAASEPGSDEATWPGWRWGTGTQSLRTYFTEILPTTVDAMPGYALEWMEREVFAGLVVSKLRSTHGAGLMVFRIADDKLVDIYVISAAAPGTVQYF